MTVEKYSCRAPEANSDDTRCAVVSLYRISSRECRTKNGTTLSMYVFGTSDGTFWGFRNSWWSKDVDFDKIHRGDQVVILYKVNSGYKNIKWMGLATPLPTKAADEQPDPELKFEDPPEEELTAEALL